VDAKAQFRSLAEPWADTGTRSGRLMMAVFGGLADVERDLIRTRTAEGRNRAQARGKHMGRSLPHTGRAKRRRAHGATFRELADSYDRSISNTRRATRPHDTYLDRRVARKKPGQPSIDVVPGRARNERIDCAPPNVSSQRSE
jgi:DNA invertase Pin-like site-specific DNA recombinase